MTVLSIKEAAKIIRKGGIVAYPTETFYGLAVLPDNINAVKKIFQIKKRDKGKPISLIISSSSQLGKWVVGVGPRERRLIKKFWPGPLTIVFKAKNKVPAILRGGEKSIALRVSSERVAKELAKKVGGAITATSANLSGQAPCLTSASVRRKLNKRIDGIVSKKKLPRSKGSTILDIYSRKPKVLREGEISVGEIKKVLNRVGMSLRGAE